MQPETDRLKQLREDAKWLQESAAGWEQEAGILERGESAGRAKSIREDCERKLRWASYAEELTAIRDEAGPLLALVNGQLRTIISFLQVYDCRGALDEHRNVRAAGSGIQQSMAELTALLAEGQPEPPLKATPWKPEAQR